MIAEDKHGYKIGEKRFYFHADYGVFRPLKENADGSWSVQGSEGNRIFYIRELAQSMAIGNPIDFANKLEKDMNFLRKSEQSQPSAQNHLGSSSACFGVL